MSASSREIFKTLLMQKKLQNKKIKIKKNKPLLLPTQFERKYKTFLTQIMNVFVNYVNIKVIPQLATWKEEYTKIKANDSRVYIDTWNEEMELEEEEYENLQNSLFKENRKPLMKEFLAIASLINSFQKKQFNKVVNSQFGFEFNVYEGWTEAMFSQWVTQNIALIKGLSDEYKKKWETIIIEGFDKGWEITKIQDELQHTSKVLTESRSRLIARDQIEKLNAQIDKQRQKDAGVNYYRWRTAGNERVRGDPNGLYPDAKPSHYVLDGMLCSWDDPTIYSDDNGKTWKKRSSIDAVELHPGEDYQCQCYPDPAFDILVEEEIE